MLYRVSQPTLYRNINTNLNLLSWEMGQINNQIATGKRVLKPSDDPAGGSVIFSMRSVLAGVDQYNQNVALSDDWLKETESVIQNMKLIVEEAQVRAEQMSTDTYQDENLEVAAEEIDKLFEALIKMGNTRIGDRYIFSGQMTDTQPFDLDLFIHDPQAYSNNSTSFTGQIMAPPADQRDYEFLADWPDQTKAFIIEITSAGGVGGDAFASLTLDPPGAHDALFYQASSALSGVAGNGIQVAYVDPGAINAALSVAVSGTAITVTLGTDQFGDVDSTAFDVMSAINNLPAASALVDVSLAPGNSGNGLMADSSTATGALASGYCVLGGGLDGAALFRVSEDGGLTWGPPQEYSADTNATSIWNSRLGHATLTTSLPGYGLSNDIQFTAVVPGEAGNRIHIEYVAGAGPLTVSDNYLDDTVTVTFPPGTTAQDVIDAVNDPLTGSRLVMAATADYRSGATGPISTMSSTCLCGGVDNISALGQATLTTDLTGGANDLTFIANTDNYAGSAGNAITIEYVLSAAAVTTTAVVSGTAVTIHLQTNASGLSVATANDVLSAIKTHNGPPPASDLIWVTLSDYDDGGTGVVSAMSVIPLEGGLDSISGDQGVEIFFTDDGSALQVGDRFYSEVSYFKGDSQDIDVNVDQGARSQINISGEDVLGATGATDNILDTLARLAYALREHDTDMVADEIPRLDEAMEVLTTQMAQAGVRLIRNQFTYNTLSATEENSTERMSRIEDLDIADAVTELTTKQTAYQAALAAISLTTRLSLVDYIS